MITTKAFWTGAAERAVKTFCQVFVAVVFLGVGADAVGVTAGIADVDWLDALSVAGLATVLSVVTSVGNASFTAGKPETLPAERGADGVYNVTVPRTVEDEDGRA